MKIKINWAAVRKLGLKSEGVRNLVYAEGEERRARLASAIGADKVDSYRGGISRGRFTLRRLEPLRKESADGLLSRTLRGGI